MVVISRKTPINTILDYIRRSTSLFTFIIKVCIMSLLDYLGKRVTPVKLFTIKSDSGADGYGWGKLTPEMAAEYLRSGRLECRSFAQTLRELYPGEDMAERLIDGFTGGEGGLGRSSASRKVRNWLCDKNIPVDREELFRLSFALGLTEGQTSRLLGQCTDCGIHYRDGRDVIYAWFLRRGGSYSEARAFFASLPPMPNLTTPLPACAGGMVTHELQASFQRVRSVEELRECYIEKLPLMGELHLRAFAYFDKYFAQLISPDPGLVDEDEPNYSVDMVMELYLSMNMPSGRERSGLSSVQKLIKHGWPNATALKKIRARQADVPRKLLLLLYVVTENVLDGGYTEADEAYITWQERLEDHWWTLNAILSDCGMPILDPRDPTDWLVLYSMTAGSEPMSNRMSEVIESLFPD